MEDHAVGNGTEAHKQAFGIVFPEPFPKQIVISGVGGVDTGQLAIDTSNFPLTALTKSRRSSFAIGLKADKDLITPYDQPTPFPI